MAGDVRVIEDGVERRSPKRRPSSPWLWLIVGFAAGLGFGIVFAAQSTAPGGQEPGTPNIGAPTPSPTEPDGSPAEAGGEPVGVSDVIPEFPDAIVAIVRSEGRSLDEIIWPVAGDEVARDLPVGYTGQVKIDSSGRFLAVVTPLPGSAGELLSMGRQTSVGPVASGVTSFAWHDGKPAALAYTQIVEGEWLLWVVHADGNPELVTRGVGIDRDVVTWGAWGWALQDWGDEEVTLLNPSGDLKAIAEGTVLASRPDGWLVVADEGLSLVSAGGGVDRLDVSLDSVGSVLTASFSPDGEKIAVASSSALLVVSLVEEADPIEAGQHSAINQIVWSSDSRFVVFPALRGFRALDTEDQVTHYSSLGERVVVALAVISLTGS